MKKLDVTFYFDKQYRHVVLEIGQEYIIAPLKPGDQKDQGRHCLLLDFVPVTTQKPNHPMIKIQYLDNNQIDQVELDQLLPVEGQDWTRAGSQEQFVQPNTSPEGEQQHPEAIVYEIDAADHIIFVNDAWQAFAHENGSKAVTREAVLNKSLWNFIVDPETIYLYSIILQTARSGKTVTFELRCDSPQLRRFLELQVSSLGGGAVRFESRTLKEEERDWVELLAEGVARSTAFLSSCSWCKRFNLLNGHWAEVEEAINVLELFGTYPLPHVTHGTCPACYEKLINLALS